MLVNKVNGEPVGASMVRDSGFYIEIAKFVQAYSVIINNPNEFLAEVGESSIDEKKGRVSWAQLVKIMQKCDFGFLTRPSEVDLKVYYNYALEIGSLDSMNQKVATVSDVAEAQKHYYNFVDKAKDKAETEYLKQHKIYLNREAEMRNVDNELSKLKGGRAFGFIMMMFSVAISVFGIISFFASNAIASGIGKIIPIWKANYVGGIIIVVIGILLFFLFDKLHEKFKRKHFKLKNATETIFARGNESYATEIYLKRKLTTLTKQLKIVQAELNDKHKRFDVQENINRLKATNKYYQKFAEPEESYSAEANVRATDGEKNLRPEDFAPVVLTREQEENLRRVGKEAITLEGQFDEEAYKEKFEKARSEEEKEQEEQAEVLEENNIQEKTEAQTQLEEQQLKIQEKELLESIDYIKQILGFTSDDGPEKTQ